MFIGVPTKQRAAAEVGCILQEKLTDVIITWEAVSERIMLVELKNQKGKITTIIFLYRPEKMKKDENERFWEDLTAVTERVKRT